MASHADAPAIDVVLLTWNDGPLLARSIAAIERSEGVHARLVVVDNGSDRPVTVSAPDAVVLRLPKNLGVAVGRTFGASVGTAPFLAFVDSDAEVHADTLARLARLLYRDSSIGLAGPVFDGQPPEASAGLAPTLRRKVLRALNHSDRYDTVEPDDEGLRDVDFVIGACQVVRRTAWESVGGLDTAIFYGPEDVDFCLRLKGASWRIVQDSRTTCVHPARRRFKNVLSRRGAAHSLAVVRHLWRHRGYSRDQ